MRFEQLKCLQEIARTGSISAAAKNLFVSQQSVSTSIKHLEDELDVHLMIRTSSGVSMTEEGKKVLEYAEIILQEKEKLINYVRNQQVENLLQKNIKINITSKSSVLNILIPRILVDLEMQMKKPRIVISDANSLNDIIMGIRDGDYDAGFITANKERLANVCADSALAYEIIVDDEIVAVTNKKNVHFEQRSFSCEEDKTQWAYFNFEPAEKYWDDIKERSSISNDVNYYIQLLKEVDSVVITSGISARLFFDNKKYAVLPVDTGDRKVKLAHAVIYKQNGNKEIPKLIEMLRQTMIYTV